MPGFGVWEIDKSSVCTLESKLYSVLLVLPKPPAAAEICFVLTFRTALI